MPTTKPPTVKIIYGSYGGVLMRYTYDTEPCCCRCGVALPDHALTHCGHYFLPPCCMGCEANVALEMLKFEAAWPNGWFGHWTKSSADGGWMQI